MKYKIKKPFIKFIGEDSWISISFSPNTINASNDKILKFESGKNDVSYADTLSDEADFLRSIETGKPSLEPLEVGNNVYMLTMMGLIATELGYEVTWDQKAGRFVNDNAADAMLTRPFREKWMDKNVVNLMNKFQQFDLE